jgi:DNA-binding transcriptional LysR family regulator
LDWDDLKIALAIARRGSLNGAARALGTTQPTVSRRLDGLERRIGAKLFERAASGLSPTALCIALVESLNHMEEGALAVERRIAGRDTGLQGPITVTSLAWFGDDVLAPLLARFSARHKLVTIDLINDPRRFNLSRREADIATAEAGEAIAVLPRVLADRRSLLLRLEPPLPEPSNTVKLGVHADMRDTPRIRALIDFLVAELKARSGELNPGGTCSALRSKSPRR